MSAPKLAVSLTCEEMKQLVREVLREEGALRKAKEDSAFLTLEETADLLRCDPKTVRRYSKELGLKTLKLGQKWRFLRSDVLQWASEQKQSG